MYALMWSPVIQPPSRLSLQAAYRAMFRGADDLFVPQIFGHWVIDCFTGRYGDYQPVDARYHDFEHTLQGTLCMARIWCMGAIGQMPSLGSPKRMFELGMLAILLHDTGYLKKKRDFAGTGAKYTAVHVGRSAEFAKDHYSPKKAFCRAKFFLVQNMILCTGINAALDKIPFQSELEKIVGFVSEPLKDLLGQMAADDYVEKLPVLYAEFDEAGAL